MWRSICEYFVKYVEQRRQWKSDFFPSIFSSPKMKMEHNDISIQFNYFIQILKLYKILFTLEMNIHTVW